MSVRLIVSFPLLHSDAQNPDAKVVFRNGPRVDLISYGKLMFSSVSIRFTRASARDLSASDSLTNLIALR
jgi:hypothetical protein